MRDAPLWFRSFVWCELLVQLPFFFAAAHAYAFGRRWVRAPMLMYGAHAATTVVPMLAEFWSHAANPGRWSLVAMYGTYALVPLLLALDMARRPDADPFGGARKRRGGGKAA